MKFYIFFIFLACLASISLTQGYSNRCPLACSKIYQPVCGKQLENGVWVKRWFSNSCEMKNENVCDGGDYIPCREYED